MVYAVSVRVRADSASQQVMILSPAFMKYVHESWLDKKGRYPSTGFLTVALSMYMCDEVGSMSLCLLADGNVMPL